MTPRVVYDTNVVVSAVLKAVSIPAFVVALALGGQIYPCLSPIIFDEYETVLKRPKFGFNIPTVDAFLRDLRMAAIVVSPLHQIHTAPHEPDNRRPNGWGCPQARRDVGVLREPDGLKAPLFTSLGQVIWPHGIVCSKYRNSQFHVDLLTVWSRSALWQWRLWGLFFGRGRKIDNNRMLL
jgi:hypothetical protein